MMTYRESIDYSIIIKSMAMALLVTLVTFYLMQQLISTEFELEETPPTTLPNIVMPNKQIKPIYEDPKPVRPDDPQDEPEDHPETKYEDPGIKNTVNIDPPDTTIKFTGQHTGLPSEGDYLPIVKVNPRYPNNALRRGIEGYVIVEFTVTTSGAVKDPFVVEAMPEKTFNNAALKAASKFKYKPRVVDGTPIEVHGVRNKITFALSK